MAIPSPLPTVLNITSRPSTANFTLFDVSLKLPLHSKGLNNCAARHLNLNYNYIKLNNNNNKHDNVYGAVIMAEPLREFTRFI